MSFGWAANRVTRIGVPPRRDSLAAIGRFRLSVLPPSWVGALGFRNPPEASQRRPVCFSPVDNGFFTALIAVHSLDIGVLSDTARLISNLIKANTFTEIFCFPSGPDCSSSQRFATQ